MQDISVPSYTMAFQSDRQTQLNNQLTLQVWFHHIDCYLYGHNIRIRSVVDI